MIQRAKGEAMDEQVAGMTTYIWHDVHGPVYITSWGGSLSPTSTPVVLVHGLGGNFSNWALLAPKLRGVGLVTAVDLPGFGRSEPGTRQATIEENSAVLIRYLENIGQPALLCGNSMGGMISILVASRRPDLVSRLVLLSPALPLANIPLPQIPARGAEVFLSGYGFLVSPLVRRLDTRMRVRLVLSFCGVDPDSLPPEHIERAMSLISDREDIVGMDKALIVAARSLVRILGNGAAYRNAMVRVKCPVLLIHGTKDRLVPVENARAARNINPSWKYVEYRGAGHILQLEMPEQIYKEIDKWMGELE